MKLKSKVKIAKGWRRERIFMDIVETLWMSFVPLFCGMMFGLTESHNLIWLVFAVMPVIFKLVYSREDDKFIIYLR